MIHSASLICKTGWPLFCYRVPNYRKSIKESSARLGREPFVNKTFNLVIMVLMFALAAWQLYVISQVGANATNVIFLLLFLAFAIRRLLIHNKLRA